MIKWGIIGFGNMGKTFYKCFDNMNKDITLNAIASKSNLKKQTINKKIKKFDNYEELIEDDNIDAVYISTLNNTHKNLVALALKNNKKVLCEKPIAVNFQDVSDLLKYTKRNANILFEALAYRSYPLINELKDILDNQNFGNIKKIESNFGFKVKKIKNESRLFNKELGGGAILDVGCYPISFFSLFNKSQKKIKITESTLDYCETNVDIDASIKLCINDNIEANGKVSFRQNLNNICKIYCDNAIVTIPEPWMPSKNTFLEIDTKKRYYKKFIKNKLDVYSEQLLQISRAFKGEGNVNKNLVNINESYQITEILDKWLRN